MPSRVIRSYSYDADKLELTIWFQSGRCYRHLDVPQRIFLAMQAAFSKGEYFNRHIRDRYQCIEVLLGGADSPRG